MEGKKFYLRTGVVAGLTVVALLLMVALLYRYQVVEAIDQDTASPSIPWLRWRLSPPPGG